MNVHRYLDVVGKIVDSPLDDDDGKIWISKYNDSYITRVGMEDDVQFLADREITEQLSHGVGFSPKHYKWFGWSHRAIHGFTIGSECKKGHIHYRPATEEDEIESIIEFWSNPGHINVTAEKVKDGEIEVTWEYDDTVPNKPLHGTLLGVTHYYNPKSFGKGEWVAETMEDAKQMAIDFNEGCS